MFVSRCRAVRGALALETLDSEVDGAVSVVSDDTGFPTESVPVMGRLEAVRYLGPYVGREVHVRPDPR